MRFGVQTIQEKFAEVLPKKREQTINIKKNYANEVIGEITVGSALGGMRGNKSMVYDTSALHHEDGIKFNGGFSIPELTEKLQKAPGGYEPLPEAVFWLLLTGTVPTDAELSNFQSDLKSRSEIPKATSDLISNLQTKTHPMTALSMAILSLQENSKFAAAYRGGTHKAEYWKTYLEDSLDLIAKIPYITAQIYNHLYRNGADTISDPNLDWAGNFSHMMGFENEEIKECMRGYLSIHSDHEGGNVSAHTYHLVQSALADPYLSYSAANNGLAGPLHGLANQEVLRFLMEVREDIGDSPTDEELLAKLKKIIESGKVIPGYGHAVLRHTDPRYTHQKAFADRNISNDTLVDLTAQMLKVAPPYLESLGKVANPWPNVDAHSGVLLYHYGLTQFDFYTAVFSVSRCLGCTAAGVWSRALGLPIERPGSITLDWIEEKFGK